MKKHYVVLIGIISQYLQTAKRLVVPQLGAFLVKEPHREILFSELIRRDDGTLRGLLVEAGMSELAAQGEIDRFVFEVRHAAKEGQEYIAEGLGCFSAGANSTIAFRYDPTIKRPVTPTVAEEPEERPAVVVVADAEPENQPERPLKVAEEPAVELVAEPVEESAEIAVAPHSEKGEDEELHLTTSVKMNPAPYVKGLKSYGKPPKNTDAFTYVDRPQRRKKVDTFLVIAIVAALIALGAIAYGYYHDWQERRAEEQSIEQLEALTAEPNVATEEATTK